MSNLETEVEENVEQLSDDPKVLKRKIKRLMLENKELHAAGDKIQQLREAEEKVKGLDNFVKGSDLKTVQGKFETLTLMRGAMVSMRNVLTRNKGNVIFQTDPDGFIRTFHNVE